MRQYQAVMKMLTPDELELLTGAFIFRGLTAGEIRRLLSDVTYTRRVFPRGTLIYSPTEFRRELGIILSGHILVTKGSLTVSELSPGDLFGAAALFTDERLYVSTLTARGRCDVIFLSQDCVSALMEYNSKIRENYIRYLAQRIRFLSAKVDALTDGTGGKKLSAYILRNAGDDGQVTVRSMTELASLLGIGRASLYRELNRLSEAGAIRHSGKTITLLKPERLK